MPITVSGTSITFNDATTQTTAFTGGGVTSLNGQTGAITTTSFDVIGSTAWLYNASTTRLTAGTTIAGSNLRYATGITQTLLSSGYFIEGSQNAPRPLTSINFNTYMERNTNGNTGYGMPSNTATVTGTWRVLHLVPERYFQYIGGCDNISYALTWSGLFVRVS